MGWTRRRPRAEPAAAGDDASDARAATFRLVELTTGDPQLPVVRFGTGLTAVVGLPSDDADRIARRIADAATGRVTDGVDGEVVVGDVAIALRDAPPIPAGVPVILSGDDVEARRRERLEREAAELASRRAETFERIAMLEAEKTALRDVLVEMQAEASRLEEQRTELRARLDVAEQRRRITEALRACQSAARLESSPIEGAESIAQRWEHFVAARPYVSADGAVSVEDAERRLDDARREFAELDARLGGVSDEAMNELETLYEEVETAQRSRDRARRKQRAAAEASLERALERESQALARYGFPSRASFLVAMSQGSRSEEDAAASRQAAEQVRQALQELDGIRHWAALGDNRSPADVEVSLRSEAAQVLGRLPGVDVAADLRDARAEPEELGSVRSELARVLAEAGNPTVDGDDVVRTARDWLERVPEVDREQRSEYEVRTAALGAEFSALAERASSRQLKLAAVDRDLEGLASDLDAIDATSTKLGDVGPSPGDLEDLIDAVRRGSGPHPVVLCGLFRDLSRSELMPLLDRLEASASDLQLVVVSELDTIADWARNNARIMVWSPEDALALHEQRVGEQKAAEMRSRAEAEARARADAEAQELRERAAVESAERDAAQRRAKAEQQELREREAAEAEARAEAEAKARQDRDAALARARAEEREKERREREAARAHAEAAAKAAAEAKAAAAKAAAEAEQERREREATQAARPKRGETVARTSDQQQVAGAEPESTGAVGSTDHADTELPARSGPSRRSDREAKRAGARARRRRARDEEIAILEQRKARRRAERQKRLGRYGPIYEMDPTADELVAGDHKVVRSTSSDGATDGDKEAPWARFEREIARRQSERGDGRDHAQTPVSAANMCSRHRNIRADVECDRCHDHFCEQCVLPVRHEIMCIDCALVASGARSTRRR